jgi:hypothetical protein
MRNRLLACLAFSLVSTSVIAEPTFLERINGASAECSIIGSGLSTEAFIARRDFGANSKKYKALVERSYAESKACVDAAKPKIKPYLKDEIVKYPQLKPAITNAYAAWLGYMDWLSSPHDWGDESIEKTQYEASINRLRAEIDAM